MELLDEVKVKMKILLDILNKKYVLFEEIHNITLNQQAVVKHDKPDMDLFEELINEKQARIDKINEMDEQFVKMHSEIKGKMEADKERYKDIIVDVQAVVKSIHDIGIKIQVIEEENRKQIERNLLTIKKKMETINKSQASAAKYYQASKNMDMNQSFFIDKRN
ncbi:MAG: flagellar protein FlgN [Clostridia bacterium]|nr:flagellar protein FlgN [Clostridia bacterium]